RIVQNGLDSLPSTAGLLSFRGWTPPLPQLDSFPSAARLLPFRSWTPSLPRLDSSQSGMDMTNTHITKEEGNKVSIDGTDKPLHHNGKVCNFTWSTLIG
ncbi:hypothetical protein Tco_1128134, partial [Tanacetum coccineum]